MRAKKLTVNYDDTFDRSIELRDDGDWMVLARGSKSEAAAWKEAVAVLESLLKTATRKRDEAIMEAATAKARANRRK